MTSRADLSRSSNVRTVIGFKRLVLRGCRGRPCLQLAPAGSRKSSGKATKVRIFKLLLTWGNAYAHRSACLW